MTMMAKRQTGCVVAVLAGGKLHYVPEKIASIRLAKKLAKSTCEDVWLSCESGSGFYDWIVTPPRKCAKGHRGRALPLDRYLDERGIERRKRSGLR